MKVKFNIVAALGNKMFLQGDVADVGDATGQELIAKSYAEEVAESTTAAEPETAEPEKPATGKKTASKATETNAE
jgi:hypothetical protein